MTRNLGRRARLAADGRVEVVERDDTIAARALCGIRIENAVRGYEQTRYMPLTVA